MKNSDNRFQVIIVGAGHAGTEAALAAARIGVNTLLLTDKLETIGQMSCNPSIGGIGKGHLVKEIDALGGAMATAIDHAGIQFRRLNASKGPAVRATRAQADRILYHQAILKLLQQQQNLTIIPQTVSKLLTADNKVSGVTTSDGSSYHAPTVVLTVGTFLNGTLYTGLNSRPGGRIGDPAAIDLANNLQQLGLAAARLKTGTPPRLAANSIDYSRLEVQPGDVPTPLFSFLGDASQHPQQINCYITHTNEDTHEIIRQGLDQSPLYTGIIASTGPRYCPSIEDKITRFADKKSHQIFLEPEGLDSQLIYPNGISTSLALKTQIALVHSIKGLEKAEISTPGYAIEYDYFDPQQLQYSLETKTIAGLFLAGQINGTTGYEEAAAQGLIAGTNAARQINNQEPWCPRRDEAYIGVMIDDLITRGTQEPYRMFTSRAEYRLLLREDNADLRLTEIGRNLGLVNDERWQAFCYKRDAIAAEKQRLQNILIRPNQHIIKLEREYRASELLRRPEISYQTLSELPQIGKHVVAPEISEQIEIQLKYDGYIKRQQREITKQRRHDETKIPAKFNYTNLSGLSNEVRQKLTRIKPTTIGQAARIPGITPAAISLLLVYLKKFKAE